jgi:predicted nucleotidyltransferase
MELSQAKQDILQEIVAALRQVDGVVAIVLGGSHAVGMATESSDLDIGIYYTEEKPFDIHEIRKVAASIAHGDQPVVTGFYEWGRWVNGGAWIKTTKIDVDFLYKNIRQISETIAQAEQGILEIDFEQQPPYGFSSVIFLAETFFCKALYDPTGIIDNLKERVKVYPQKLKASIVQQSLWAAEFAIWQGEGFAEKQDAYNALGCLTRAVNRIVMALFAINELYPMGDKRALQILESAPQRPENLKESVDTILFCTPDSLSRSMKAAKSLHQQAAALAEGLYQPYYEL